MVYVPSDAPVALDVYENDQSRSQARRRPNGAYCRCEQNVYTQSSVELRQPLVNQLEKLFL